MVICGFLLFLNFLGVKYISVGISYGELVWKLPFSYLFSSKCIILSISILVKSLVSLFFCGFINTSVSMGIPYSVPVDNFFLRDIIIGVYILTPPW